MRYRYVMLIDMIAMLLWNMFFINKIYGKHMIIKIVSNVVISSFNFCTSNNRCVEAI